MSQMTRRADEWKAKMILVNMIFNTSTGPVKPWHLKVQDAEQNWGCNLNYCITISMQKPMILALLLCRKNHCWKIYANLHSPAFKIGFQLVFYTSLTLRHCNTRILLITPLLQRPNFLSMYLLCLLIFSLPLWSMFALLHIVYNTLLQLYFKRCNIEPYLVTFN